MFKNRVAPRLSPTVITLDEAVEPSVRRQMLNEAGGMMTSEERREHEAWLSEMYPEMAKQEKKAETATARDKAEEKVMEQPVRDKLDESDDDCVTSASSFS